MAAGAAAEPTFPYKAYVTADDVYVRSGPGENYYPTDKLKAGTEVEVYRHDPGGWFAIRPPKDSFSWVSSRHLQLDGKNLATVTDERVAARVGSRMSDTRDVIQVRLHKGEVVEVLEPRRNGRADDNPSTRLVQDRAAGGRVPLGLGPLRRSRLRSRRRAADFGRRNRRSDRPGHRPLAGRVRRAAADLAGAIPEATRSDRSGAFRDGRRRPELLGIERIETTGRDALQPVGDGPGTGPRADAGEQDRAVRGHQTPQAGPGRFPPGTGPARPAGRQPPAGRRSGRPLRRQGAVDPRARSQAGRAAICDPRPVRQPFAATSRPLPA